MRALVSALVLLLNAPLAGAQATGGRDASGDSDRIRLTVAIDDREARILAAPVLRVSSEGAAPAPFLDDGEQLGDVPADRIWFAAVPVARSESLTFEVADADRDLGSFDVLLPASGAAHFALRTTAGARPLVMDLKARPPPGLPESPDGPGPVVAQASPTAGAAAADDDTIEVRLQVDDRAVQRLGAPRVLIEGLEPVVLRDDGTLEGDTAADRVWSGQARVQRAQYLSFEVLDGDDVVGTLTVFLPSSASAVLRVRTTDTDAGLEVASDTSSAETAEAPVGVAAPSRLAHVLWVAIALFAVAFAWLRQVVWRTWTGEIQPVLRRLERYLDRVDGGGAGD